MEDRLNLKLSYLKNLKAERANTPKESHLWEKMKYFFVFIGVLQFALGVYMFIRGNLGMGFSDMCLVLWMFLWYKSQDLLARSQDLNKEALDGWNDTFIDQGEAIILSESLNQKLKLKNEEIETLLKEIEVLKAPKPSKKLIK